MGLGFSLCQQCCHDHMGNRDISVFEVNDGHRATLKHESKKKTVTQNQTSTTSSVARLYATTGRTTSADSPMRAVSVRTKAT